MTQPDQRCDHRHAASSRDCGGHYEYKPLPGQRTIQDGDRVLYRHVCQKCGEARLFEEKFKVNKDD